MKILILTGSPRKNGNSNHLAEQFAKGAMENGHEVFSFDCAKHKVGGCLGCNHCGMDGPCVQNDDFLQVRQQFIDCDMIVLASPVYYFGISAQLKAVIDRFFSINSHMSGKKSALLVSFFNSNPSTADAICAFYDTICNYLHWDDKGRVLASGVWNAGDVNGTHFSQDAYALGKSV